MRTAIALALLIAGTASGASAATPSTITFGAPLTQQPDTTFTCADLPLATGATEPFPGGGSSCTWSTPENPAAPDEALATPAGDGTITAIRVRVGPATGPMSFVVLERRTDIATHAVSCCAATLVTQPVMPTPNEVNAFRADLPVHTDAPEDQTSPGTQVTDFLALAVLNSATPIPAIDETGSGLPVGQMPQDAIQSPAPLQAATAPIVQTAGYQLDMQADWVPGTPAPATPRVHFASGRVWVGKGYLHLPLRCRYDTCTGSIVVRVAGGSPPYAAGSFHIGQNLYRSIAVPLTRTGRLAARSGKRLDVSIEVTYRTPGKPKAIRRSLMVTF